MDTRREKLLVYQREAGACRACSAEGLVYVSDAGIAALPLFQRNATGELGILVVAEAPNVTDTFDADKGCLTYNDETDETGRFMSELLIREVGLTEPEIHDVLFTNAALCLPVRKNDRHPVSAKQLDHCRSWLCRLIEDAEAEIVVTLGAVPLAALNRIEPHTLTLRDSVGRIHAWLKRSVLPLYHPGRLGRANRPAEQQRRDIAPLRAYVEARKQGLVRGS